MYPRETDQSQHQLLSGIESISREIVCRISLRGDYIFGTADGNPSNQTQQDRDAFAALILQAMQSDNLNQYVDMGFLSIPGFIGSAQISRTCNWDPETRTYSLNCRVGGQIRTVGVPRPEFDADGNLPEDKRFNADALSPPRTKNIPPDPVASMPLVASSLR